MALLISFVFAIIFGLNTSKAARILAVFPTPLISHQAVFRPLTQELTRRGHEVVVITTHLAFSRGQTPENLTEINVYDVSHEKWKELISKMKHGEESDYKNQIKNIGFEGTMIFEEQSKVPEVRDIIENRNGTFDLILVEAWTRVVLGFSHVIKAPVIAISSFSGTLFNYDAVGAATNPVLYPILSTSHLYDFSLWKKVKLFCFLSMVSFYSNLLNDCEDSVVRRVFGQNTPSVTKLQDNIEMLFLNIHPLWDHNRPVPPNVVYLGGLHQTPQKDLPQELKNYLDSSKHGVIFISFGSNVNTKDLPLYKIQMMIKEISQLRYDVFWKWDGDKLPGRAKNIRISKWFPQPDLLRHPKVKLFITQGGLQSIDEAITAGVPLIGIPMISDQWYNVEQCVHYKIGLRLDFSSLEADILKRSIESVIEDKSYRKNILHLRSVMNDQPMSSLERAVWWTEHVLRHGGARHLRAPAANMPWTQYYEIELVSIVLSIFTASMIMTIIILNRILKLIVKLMHFKQKRC